MNHTRYGETQLVGKSYVSTEKGMMIYKVNFCEAKRMSTLGCHGGDVALEEMLEQFEQAQEQSGMTDMM